MAEERVRMPPSTGAAARQRSVTMRKEKRVKGGAGRDLGILVKV